MDENKPVSYTPEEIEKLREVRMSFMTKQMDDLATEALYTKHRADIAENQYRELLSKRRYAELTAPRPEPVDNPLSE